MAGQYIIYADESTRDGEFFSNFYGGVLIHSKDIDEVRETLKRQAEALYLNNEIKWTKVTENYLQKYIAMMDVFFDLVQGGKIKYRLMFTQNCYIPQGLSRAQRDNAYFLLYYQFIKHAFGLQYANPTGDPVSVRLYFDRFPDTKEKIAQFRSYLLSLQYAPEFRRANITLSADQIAEVDSHDHIVLQCLDVVTGAMQFRLNDRHKVKPSGATRRGKRTIAKEKLYKHILGRIRQIHPNFNIGVSTGTHGNLANRWLHPYRHWRFVTRDFVLDEGKTKSKPRCRYGM